MKFLDIKGLTCFANACLTVRKIYEDEHFKCYYLVQNPEFKFWRFGYNWLRAGLKMNYCPIEREIGFWVIVHECIKRQDLDFIQMAIKNKCYWLLGYIFYDGIYSETDLSHLLTPLYELNLIEHDGGTTPQSEWACRILIRRKKAPTYYVRSLISKKNFNCLKIVAENRPEWITNEDMFPDFENHDLNIVQYISDIKRRKNE